MEYSVTAACAALKPAAQEVTAITMTVFGAGANQPAWPGFPWQVAQFGPDVVKEVEKPRATNAITHALKYWQSITPEIAENVWSDVKVKAETLIFGKPRSELTREDWSAMTPELATLHVELSRLDLEGTPEPPASYDSTLNSIYHQRLAIGRELVTKPRWDRKKEVDALLGEIQDFDALVWNAAKDNVGEFRTNFTDAVKLVADRGEITSSVLGDQQYRLGNSVKWVTEHAMTQLNGKSTIFEIAN